MSARNTRFIERVRCERQALAYVNSAFEDTEPLNALSGPAIESWKMSAAKSGQRSKIDTVSNLLRELSLRLDIQANNSREIFESVSAGPDAELLLASLGTICK